MAVMGVQDSPREGTGHFLEHRAHLRDLAIVSTIHGKHINFLFYLIAFVALLMFIYSVLLSLS